MSTFENLCTPDGQSGVEVPSSDPQEKKRRLRGKKERRALVIAGRASLLTIIASTIRSTGALQQRKHMRGLAAKNRWE